METVDVRGDGLPSRSTARSFGYRFAGFRPDWSEPPCGERRTTTKRTGVETSPVGSAVAVRGSAHGEARGGPLLLGEHAGRSRPLIVVDVQRGSPTIQGEGSAVLPWPGRITQRLV